MGNEGMDNEKIRNRKINKQQQQQQQNDPLKKGRKANIKREYKC